jgi:hypothetical protein
VPEQAKIEYVVFNNDAVSQVSVSDTEVSDYYAKNTAQFTTPETRRASHILVAVKGASAADTAPPRPRLKPSWPKCARRRPTSPKSPKPNRKIRARQSRAATWA